MIRGDWQQLNSGVRFAVFKELVPLIPNRPLQPGDHVSVMLNETGVYMELDGSVSRFTFPHGGFGWLTMNPDGLDLGWFRSAEHQSPQNMPAGTFDVHDAVQELKRRMLAEHDILLGHSREKLSRLSHRKWVDEIEPSPRSH